MGTMTRLEIKSEVLSNLDNRQDIPDATVNRWINHSYSHMTHPGVHEFEDLRTVYDLVLVSGQDSYSLATAVVGYRILAIRGATYINAASGSILTTTRRRRLRPKPIQWYDNRTHPAGEPQHYVAGEGQTILLSNTPNNTNTVRLRLFREAATLSGDSSTTVLPEYFDECLVTGSQAFAEFKLGMRDRANETFQLYSALLNGGADKSTMEGVAWGYEVPLVSIPAMGVSS